MWLLSAPWQHSLNLNNPHEGAGTRSAPSLNLMPIPPDPAGDPAMMPSPEAEPGGGGNELCIPLSALTVQDESGDVAPEMGQPISGNVEGTISRIEGDMAYITPTKFNGTDIPKETEAPQESDEQYLDRVSQEGNP